MITVRNAYNDQPAASAVLIGTADSNCNWASISKMTVSNDTTASITFKTYIVPSGESVGDAYIIYNDYSLGSKESFDCPLMVGQKLDAGDLVYVHPSAANQLSTKLDLIEVFGE